LNFRVATLAVFKGAGFLILDSSFPLADSDLSFFRARRVPHGRKTRTLAAARVRHPAPAPLAVILSEAKNLSVVLRMARTVTERFFASLRMTPGWGLSQLHPDRNVSTTLCWAVPDNGGTVPKWSMAHLII